MTTNTLVVPQVLNTYESIPKGIYALKRDFSASTRLTAQYYLWKDALKFNLHPSIPAGDKGVRIADVATGNCIWVLDVAREVSETALLDGFDIKPPKEFIEAFDVVHIRLITVAIKNNDPRPVLANLCKLLKLIEVLLYLKPGGYLQWDEADSVGWTIKSVHSSVATDAVQRLFQTLWLA
ncbi:hypothetical protein LCER1_G004100 [Lachnellula cervina]|uniref:Methyltransferase domain-containing protein n=1 Tax=Lachnellula cervina TaxID=1316786 RepID=A0A7D8YNC5_9HELO|nr:hypothetical protein LCER1_G004100 [Lachnellula cervina]